MSLRSAMAVAYLGLFAAPLALPLLELSRSTANVWAEAGRLTQLAGQTFALAGLTLLFVLPLGISLAILLERTDCPGRRAWRALLGAALFVPLPLFALGWQAVAGGAWRPWTQGTVPAAAIHALAALPWVVWLTGLGLARVEAELEEDARLSASAFVVLWKVSLRRSAPTIGLAALWVILQAAGEITVTDLALVRTFAEEVYTQFVTAGPDALGRAVAVSLPATLLAVVGAYCLTRRWENRIAFAASPRPTLTLSLGAWRRPIGWLVGVGTIAFVAVPIGGLIRQAGGENWTFARLGIELRRAATLNAGTMADSLAWAALAGLIATGLALAGSWLALDSKRFARITIGLAIALWAVPGPVLGFGIKAAIDRIMDLEDVVLAGTSIRPLRAILYELSTPLPVLWAHVARLFPYAVAILWPAVRDVPRDLREQARVDGASAWGEFRRVGWPATRRAFALSTFAVAALALGELGASKLVQVPGRLTFVQELFNQMHYAATSTTASLALVQLGMAIGVWGLVSRMGSPSPRSRRPPPTILST